MNEDKLKKMEELKHVIRGLEDVKSWIIEDRVTIDLMLRSDPVMMDWEGNGTLLHVIEELGEIVKWLNTRIEIYTNHLRKLQGLEEGD
jgi:hypothetical protein